MSEALITKIRRLGIGASHTLQDGTKITAVKNVGGGQTFREFEIRKSGQLPHRRRTAEDVLEDVVTH